MSDSFSVSNGVRQGRVFSPVLFAVYLDIIRGLTLWVQCAMQMTLLCSIHDHQLSELCSLFVRSMESPMGSSSTLIRRNLYASGRIIHSCIMIVYLTMEWIWNF